MLEGLLKRARNPDKRDGYEAELDCPPFPLELEYLWTIFHRLSRRRSSSGFAVSPITWPDIDAFLRNSGIRLTPWELQIIESLDDLFRIEMGKARE